MSSGRIIQRGAEAVLCLEENGTLTKDRVSKGYRILQIDEMVRKRRSKLETRLLERAKRSGVNAPGAKLISNYTISMDYINGDKLKDVLNNKDKDEQVDIAKKIGELVAKLHMSETIHGDLTTSNMILKDNDIYVIDFGLGKVSFKVEDKATDLFLLWEALASTHYEISREIWNNIINTYVQKYSKASEVIKRLEEIKKRRRYK